MTFLCNDYDFWTFDSILHVYSSLLYMRNRKEKDEK